MRIVIIGSNSKLSKHILSKLKENKNWKLIRLSRANFNYIEDIFRLQNYLKKLNPDFIINCSAVTTYLECEKHSKLSFKVNSLFPLVLAKVSLKLNCKLIHFSTDAVFGNHTKKLSTYKDETNPENKLGLTKLIGDLFLKKYENTIIVRLPILYGTHFHDSFFGKSIKSLKNNKKIYIAKDVYCSPTSAEDVAEYIKNLLKKIFMSNKIDKRLIHLSSDQRVSRYEYLLDIAKKIGKERFLVGNFHRNIRSKVKPLKNMGLKCNVNDFYQKNIKIK